MKIVTRAQMQWLDRATITEAQIPGLALMEHAGTGVVEQMEDVFGPLADRRVTILCGKGNNGGDGFVVARLLKKKRVRIQVVLLAKPAELTADARTMYQRLVKLTGSAAIQAAPSKEKLQALLGVSDVIIDALLGTGLASPVTGPYLAAIEAINDAEIPVVAVDLPSGIDADTGAILGASVRASLTVTFGLPKLGLYLGSGIDHAGTIRVVDIGIPQAFVERVDSRVRLLTSEEIRGLIPRRTPSSHKGTYGHAGIIAGSVGKTGAAALAAKAALRIGAGLVTVATPASANNALEAKLLEAMTVPMPETESQTLARSGLDRLLAFANERSAVAIGPGLTTHQETADLVQALLPRLEKPSVLDADALNALAGHTALLSSCKTAPILTPHPGEMARLDDHAASSQTVNADRIGTATRFAQRHGVILVLKGARTVIAHPDGRAAICPTGNPGMATAGTGDVLTGVLAGLLAQRLTAWDAACAGVYLHGLAGDMAAADLGPAGMIAGDLLERIPHAIIRTGTTTG